jgi:hypothetical protein
MKRVIAALAVLLLAAPAGARADVQYAGSAYRGTVPYVPAFSLVRREDGVILARIGFPYRCHGHSNTSLVARLTGRATGEAFTATGSTKPLRGVPRIRFTLSGTLTADGGSGKIRLRAKGCRGYTRNVVFRTEAAPVGGPAFPRPNSMLLGLSAQTAASVRLPVVIRVAKNGRVFAIWHVSLFCGKGNITRIDATPVRTVRPDGTFGGNQTYRIRYSDGTSQRYRVNFSGRFTTDGAAGTLRMTMTERGYKPCRSGTVAWTAR